MFDLNRPRAWRALTLAGALWLTGCATTPPAVTPSFSADTGDSPGSVLAFNAKINVLAAGAADGRVHLLRVPDGQRIDVWQTHQGEVTGLAFLRDGRLLSVGYDGTLALWSADGKLVTRADAASPATDLVLIEDDNSFWTGHGDGSVRQWRLDTLAPRQTLARHRSEVRAVAYDRKTGRIASSGYDGKVYIGRSHENARALPAPPTDARDLVFMENGRVLIGGGWFKLFRWDVETEHLVVLPTDHYGIITQLDLHNDGRTLASISRQTDSAVRLLDPRTGATLKYFSTHDLCGAAVRLSPDGRYLASSSDDAEVRVFALDSASSAVR